MMRITLITSALVSLLHHYGHVMDIIIRTHVCDAELYYMHVRDVVLYLLFTYSTVRIEIHNMYIYMHYTFLIT